MDWNVVAVFPIEIWERIITFCDGKTLITFSRLDKTFNNIINSLDERRNIWRNCCHHEIPEDDRIDIYRKLYPDEKFVPQWQHVYDVWRKWEEISLGKLEASKMPKWYLYIADIKVSNETIVIADKTGFSLLNSTTGENKRYKIGPVKHIELVCRRSDMANRSKKNRFLHDILDCTIANFHFFFDLQRVVHLRTDKHENEILRYCYNRKKSKFMPPIVEADVFDDLILLVSETSIRQAVEPMFVISQYNYSWSGARCWFLWHARLLFCAKDHQLDIYLDGRMRNFPFGEFPRTSAIFYFRCILLLGSVHGTLYIYRVRADDIFSFDFSSYLSKLDLCARPIIAIDIVENNTENSCIIAATDHEIYRLCPKTFNY